jgi:hypothetical protein
MEPYCVIKTALLDAVAKAGGARRTIDLPFTDSGIAQLATVAEMRNLSVGQVLTEAVVTKQLRKIWSSGFYERLFRKPNRAQVLPARLVTSWAKLVLGKPRVKSLRSYCS